MATFTLSRETTVAATPAAVHALLDNFHHWTRWSPWEGLDPDLRREYTGAEAGVGARYHWSGNSQAGEGTMEIVESTPDRVVVDLRFLKPFKATNGSRFDLTGEGDATRVVWTMTGRRNPLMQLMGRLFFDKAIAKDFEKGLADLRAAAEQG
ncbi:MAG: SRPBCC family protein [Nocardioides sp.]|uniref:SRPBCC family protein n=1 Tax=Nocardioides sp. TaxID=35761 RepID=UPI003F0F36C2